MKKKKGIKWRLAVTGIKKNSKLYLPYILAGAGMVAVFYIMMELSCDELLTRMKAGNTLSIILRLGVIVLGVFSISMLFYTNSFLIKTRTKEFGLYNILGMDRRNISGILVAETAITGAVCIVGGVALGLLFSKLVEAFLARLLGISADYEVSIDLSGIGITVIVFAAFFFVVMLKNVFVISRRKTIDLLKNDKLGEKPPKARYFLAFIGFAILALAYYIAVSITDPIGAVTFFFIAVIMVIVATMILFIVGSVTICKLLQKKKGYYYKTNHFVSLSSMSFRMKRNGAGLAEICILSTMVLVMIASTSCLYFGKESMLDDMYPREYMNIVSFCNESIKEEKAATKDEIKGMLYSVAEDNGIRLKNEVEMEYLFFSMGSLQNEVLFAEQNRYEDSIVDEMTADTAWDIFFVSLEDYNRYMNTDLVLAEDEAVCCEYTKRYPFDSISIDGSEVFNIKQRVSDFYSVNSFDVNVCPKAVFVVNELPEDFEGAIYEKNDKWEFNFDFEYADGRQPDSEQKKEITDIFHGIFVEEGFHENKNLNYNYWRGEDKELNRSEFFEMYGGLFFLGIVLSVVFICALGLMIYYKQISEGYEDRSRFEIMKKVGMTEKDIRSSINSQMGTVFFLPLVAAVIHLCFAFPMIYRCLILFGVVSLEPLFITSLISVVIFAIIYTIVYKITSNSYYRLVR